jgi:hypothetical protein
VRVRNQMEGERTPETSNNSSDGKRRISTINATALELDSRESSFCEEHELEDEDDEDSGFRRDRRKCLLELDSRATSICDMDDEDHSVETEESCLLDNLQLFNEFKLSLVHLYGSKAKLFFEKETEYMLAKLDDVMLMGLTNVITKEIDKKIRDYVFDTNSLADQSRLSIISSAVHALSEEEEADIVRLSQSSVWQMASKDWVTARRDALTAAKTYEETMKAIAFEKQKAFLHEQQLVETVKLKDKEFVLIYRCEQNTGLIGSEALTRARQALEEAEESLISVKKDNAKFLHDSLDLESILGKLKLQKEKVFAKLMLSNEERNVAEIREESQELRRAAYAADKLVTVLHDNAKQSSDSEAIILWDDVVLKAKEAEFAWFRTLNCYQSGLTKAPKDSKNWWERAIETSKNAIYVKRVAINWYEARKAECLARLAEAAVSSASSHSIVMSTELWDDAISKAMTVVDQWNRAAEGCRSYVDIVHDVFQDWWMEKLQAAVELEAVWTEFHNLVMQSRRHGFDTKANGNVDVAEAATAHFGSSSPSSSAKSKSLHSEEPAAFGGDLSPRGSLMASSHRVESLKSRISYNTVDLEDSMESSRRSIAVKPLFTLDIFTMSPQKLSPVKDEPCSDVLHEFEELEVQKVAMEAETERKQLRSAQQGIMSPAMCARQEATIRVCFESANIAKAKLMQTWKQPKGVTLLPGIWLSRIASSMSANKAAERNYAMAVRLEAVEDSKKDPRIANKLKEDWQNRVLADRNVVMQTRQRRDEANATQDFVQRIKANRDLLRAKAILEGDIAAFNAAWPNAPAEASAT